MTIIRPALAPVAAGLSICLAAGCGAPATRPARARAVPLSRFDAHQTDAAEAPQTWTAGWVGEFEGTAAVRDPAADGQAESQPIRLLIQATAPDRLTVLQLPAGHPNSFGLFDVEVDNTARAAGQLQAPDGDTKWEYSLSRTGPAVSGTIKLYRKVAAEDRFELGKEWTLTVTRKARR